MFMKGPIDEKAVAKDFANAVRKGQPIDVLTNILQGTDVNARDNNGLTPLHRAVKGKRPLVAQLLVSNGAEIDATGGEEVLHSYVHVAYIYRLTICLAGRHSFAFGGAQPGQ